MNDTQKQKTSLDGTRTRNLEIVLSRIGVSYRSELARIIPVGAKKTYTRYHCATRLKLILRNLAKCLNDIQDTLE